MAPLLIYGVVWGLYRACIGIIKGEYRELCEKRPLQGLAASGQVFCTGPTTPRGGPCKLTCFLYVGVDPKVSLTKAI